MVKILIVESDSALLDALQYNLAHQEYEVCTAVNGAHALETVRQERPDLIVLEATLPGVDGLPMCRSLRQETIAPILMLTHCDGEVERVRGLDLDADDYVTKPFSMREFLARTKSLLRRADFIRQELASGIALADGENVRSTGTRLRSGDLVIDQVRREVTRSARKLRLKPQEYELLVFLVRNRGVALSRELILRQVWGWHRDVGSRTVDVHVRWLRRKIEPNPANPRRIVTVRGVGYRFEG
jgi:DNA-binding response OmpR family regulator